VLVFELIQTLVPGLLACCAWEGSAGLVGVGGGGLGLISWAMGRVEAIGSQTSLSKPRVH
jgi:hypothetical protein